MNILIICSAKGYVKFFYSNLKIIKIYKLHFSWKWSYEIKMFKILWTFLQYTSITCAWMIQFVDYPWSFLTRQKNLKRNFFTLNMHVNSMLMLVRTFSSLMTMTLLQFVNMCQNTLRSTKTVEANMHYRFFKQWKLKGKLIVWCYTTCRCT